MGYYDVLKYFIICGPTLTGFCRGGQDFLLIPIWLGLVEQPFNDALRYQQQNMTRQSSQGAP